VDALDLADELIDDAVAEELPAGRVRQGALHNAPADAVQGRRLEPDPRQVDVGGESLLDRHKVTQDVAVDHHGHPGVVFQGRGRVLCPAHANGAAEDLAQRSLLDVELTEGREDLGDVPDERVVRPDDQDPAAPQLLGMCVQEVRRPMQTDGRLPGPRAALDADHLGEGGPDDLVLVRLDRCHDVAHGAGAGPLDLGLDQLGDALNALAEADQLVLDGGDGAGVEPEPTTSANAEGMSRRSEVKGPGHVGPPVDDDGVAVRVVDVPSTDVVGLGRLARVDAAKEQRQLGVILERAQPPGQRQLQVFRRHSVPGPGLQPHHRLAHGGQVGASGIEVRLLRMNLLPLHLGRHRNSFTYPSTYPSRCCERSSRRSGAVQPMTKTLSSAHLPQISLPPSGASK
jgi:hypothetical protein